MFIQLVIQRQYRVYLKLFTTFKMTYYFVFLDRVSAALRKSLKLDKSTLKQ